MRQIVGGGMLQRPFVVVLTLLLVCGCLLRFAADATERPLLIGALTDSWGATPAIVGLQDGLRELGYRERQDVVIGVRFTQGDVAALSVAARDLVQYGVDIIFASNTSAALAAQMATKQIPIVFAGVVDPVGLGLIRSFARPQGNITGVTDLNLELSPKRLSLFQQIIPSLTRVLFLYDGTHASYIAEAKQYRDAARRLKIELVEKAVRSQAEAERVLARLQPGEVNGILAPGGLSLNIPGLISQAAVQHALPTMFNFEFFVEKGGLASYGPDFYLSGKQAARLVDKIFKGAKPAEIPVEVNPEIKLTINLKTAKALSLTIAADVLYQAYRLVR